MKAVSAFISIYLIIFCTADDMSVDIAKAFKDNEVDPDVVSEPPTELLSITYPSGVSVNYGNELTPTQVKEQPIVKWAADENSFYTLLMVDPDAPSRTKPDYREFRHWAIVNIPGNSIEKGDVVADYIGSGPPKGTGLHRYVFLVYKQPAGKFKHDEPFSSNRSRQNRPATTARAFSDKYKLGKADFGNFYQAQYDDYVPILHAQFTE